MTTTTTTPLAILSQKKFIISLAVALIVSVYAWNAIPPQDPNTGATNVSRGGMAFRLFFVTFLSIYLLSYLVENFQRKTTTTGGGGGGAVIHHQNISNIPNLKSALKQVDHSAPDF